MPRYFSAYRRGLHSRFWLMRRWALYLYTAMFVVNQIVLLVMGIWTVFALILPAIVVAIGCAYASRMR